jgi:hypothetical protein
MATDIHPSCANLQIPPLHLDASFDDSFGTEELAVFKPKRNLGRVFMAIALVCALGGGLFAVKSMGTAGLRAKAAQVASLVKKKPAAPSGAMAAAAVVAPPAAADPPVSINSLPAAGALAASTPPPPPPDKNADKNAKRKAEKAEKAAKAAAATNAKKKSSANDPTQKGTGQFDPLNGKL